MPGLFILPSYDLEPPYILLWSRGPDQAGMDFTPYEGEQQTDQTIQYSVRPLQVTTKITPGSRVAAATSIKGWC